MARSSKKKSNKIDYMAYDEATRMYDNSVLLEVARNYGEGISPLAKKMSDKFCGTILLSMPAFMLEDDKYMVQSLLLNLSYNNKLHSGVYKLIVEVTDKKTGDTKSHMFLSYSYANSSPEVVAEFVGNLCDVVAEKCWRIYQQVVDKD